MRILTLLPLLGLLTACTAPQPRPDVVRERIGEELAQAAVGRKSADAAERAMLMPFSVEMPKQENGEPRFDLSVVGAPAIQVFMAIVSGTRYNMLVGPEVTGAITISLKDVTVKETLESIRELYGYEFNIKGNRIHIQPHGLQMRVFKVNYLMARRSGRSSTSVSSGTGSPGGQPGGAQTSSPGQPGGGQAQAQMGGAGDTTSILTDTAEENQLWDDLRKAISVIIGAAAPLTQSGTATSTSGTASATSNISTQNVTINTMATTPGVVISPRSGMIVVRAAPRDLREVESYLKSTQIIVERQVMLEAKIMEVRLNEGYQAGVNWSAFRGGGNSNVALGSVGPGSALRPVNGTPAVTTRLVTDPSTGALVPYNLAYPDITSSVTSNLTTLGQTLTAPGVSVLPGLAGSVVAAAMGNGFVGLAFQTANFATLLNFLETQGSVSVLSSPRIATTNNQKALLKVGTDEVYITGFTMAQTPAVAGVAASSTPTPTTSTLFSGISLDVTPQIDEDGNIVLHVHPAISTVREIQKVFNLGGAGTISLPLASRSVRETDSIVRVQDGNIVAIGGMMDHYQSSDRSGLPGTTSSSLGFLTGQRGAESSKRELVILLKPTIIHDDRAWMKDIEQSGERVRSMGLPPLSVPLN